MDREVLDAMARWPQVPAVYGWLALDRRGNWLLRESEGGRLGRIGNAALREFIGRNYAADARGCWYFQNGPQRVFVELAYTPWVLHYEGVALRDGGLNPAMGNRKITTHAWGIDGIPAHGTLAVRLRAGAEFP